MDLASLAVSAEPFLGPVRLVSASDVTLDVSAWNNRVVLDALRTAGWKGGKVVYLSVYPRPYIRTEAMMAILKRAGVDLETRFFGSRLALLHAVPSLAKQCEVIVLGFRSHELLPFVRMLAPHAKILFDAFVSVADTFDDRGIAPLSSVLAWPFRIMDKTLCRLANAVLVDTQAHADFFRSAFECAHVFPLYLENDATYFGPGEKTPSDVTRVLWYGTCQPLHGVDKILQWAASLDGKERVVFRLIGPVHKRYGSLLHALKLSNVDLVEHLSLSSLASEIHTATLCLAGPFGNSGKASRVIPGKIYQMLACEAPVLIADTQANRELFGSAMLHA